MYRIIEFVFGMMLAIFISKIVDYFFGDSGILYSVDMRVFEHYHLGMIILLITDLSYTYWSLLAGLAQGFFIDECTHDRPFAIGKVNEIYSHLIGLLLTIGVILKYFVKPF